MEKQKLGDLIGISMEEDFLDFDLSEIQLVLRNLSNNDPIDLAHTELLQLQALRGADVLSEYLGRMVKIVSYLESKLNSAKNKASLDYQAPNGKTTVERAKWAGEAAPEVEELQVKLAKAKGSKIVLEKKYDILIRSHHFYKDIANGMKKTILGSTQSAPKIAEGWGE